MSDTKKTAIVTGGSRGIGKACALALAKDGYRIVLTYVSKPELADEVVAAIREQGGEAEAVLLDVADREAVVEFFKDRKDSGIDVLVNNAGITKDGLLIRMKDEDWDKVLHINLTGAFTCLREAAKIMARQRCGRIINISSIAGEMGNAGQANYSAAKAGLIGLTKTTARELAGRGVTVNAVTPRRDRNGHDECPFRQGPRRHAGGHSHGPSGNPGRHCRGCLLPGVRRRCLHHRTHSVREWRHVHVTTRSWRTVSRTTFRMEERTYVR